VTITGPAGIGKTRLALAAAADMHDCFPDGVIFVDLSTVTDPDRALVAIGRSLQLLDLTPASALERVRDLVRDQSLVLVLDNFEQVLPAAADLATLLGVTDRLKLLITSRARLRLRWEHVIQVPPLDLPDLGRVVSRSRRGRGLRPALRARQRPRGR
jgi:predicted ATPase